MATIQGVWWGKTTFLPSPLHWARGRWFKPRQKSFFNKISILKAVVLPNTLIFESNLPPMIFMSSTITGNYCPCLCLFQSYFNNASFIVELGHRKATTRMGPFPELNSEQIKLKTNLIKIVGDRIPSFFLINFFFISWSSITRVPWKKSDGRKSYFLMGPSQL